MKTTDDIQTEFEARSSRANASLISFQERIRRLIDVGPNYLAGYASDSWDVIKDHTEITKDNGKQIRDSLMKINRAYQDEIYKGLVERGEADASFALLHDIIHDAASLTNGIHILSRKW